MKTKYIIWILIGFGALNFLPLFAAQLLMLLKPKSQKTKDLLIGKGENWRDKTHYKSALAFAWADLLIILPLFIWGSIWLVNENAGGYVVYFALGVVSIYFSILFWVLEKEYTYKAAGCLAYYTYYWGFYLYWGIAAVVFSALQLIHIY